MFRQTAHTTARELATRGPVAGPSSHWLAGELPGLVALYHWLHSHPELSLQEVATAQALADELRRCGVRVTTRIGGHGVVGRLVNGPGPTIMLRTDMDALPVSEESGLDYASTVRAVGADGRKVAVMHACGHDLHVANLVGAARFLAAHRNLWRGTVLFVGQPAEEHGTGAAAMLADGMFTRFGTPDAALAVHVAPELSAGTIGLTDGQVTAHVDSCDIVLRGRGGHGAYPHRTIDPIVLAAQLVVDLQTIVSRELPPTEPAVLTVGSIQGGAASNVIADECRLQLTLRSRSDAVRQHLKEAIARRSAAAAIAVGAPAPSVEFGMGLSALQNDPHLVDAVRKAATGSLGAEGVVSFPATMGAEDFAVYGEAGVRCCLIRLGSVASERLARMQREGVTPPPLHASDYYPDPEPTLRTGVRVLGAAALALLGRR